MEEDAAIFKGLMLSTRQAFEKAKNEHLTASYALWEEYDKELPSVQRKIKELTDQFKPILEQTNLLKDMLQTINTFDIERLLEVISKITSTYGESREMFEFLINNFKKQ